MKICDVSTPATFTAVRCPACASGTDLLCTCNPRTRTLICEGNSSSSSPSLIFPEISVEHVKTYNDKIASSGGQVIHTFTVPGMGYGAVALDPEGNVVGLFQSDSAAKEN